MRRGNQESPVRVTLRRDSRLPELGCRSQRIVRLGAISGPLDPIRNDGGNYGAIGFYAGMRHDYRASLAKCAIQTMRGGLDATARPLATC